MQTEAVRRADGGGPSYPVDRLGVLEERARAEAPRHQEQVDAGRVLERVPRHEHDPAGRGDGLLRLGHREDVEQRVVLGA